MQAGRSRLLAVAGLQEHSFLVWCFEAELIKWMCRTCTRFSASPITHISYCGSKRLCFGAACTAASAPFSDRARLGVRELYTLLNAALNDSIGAAEKHSMQRPDTSSSLARFGGWLTGHGTTWDLKVRANRLQVLMAQHFGAHPGLTVF